MENHQDHRLDYPATGRNKDVILDVLKQELPREGHVLEIGSGSGQHAVHFQPEFPGVVWQTSDPFAEARRSVAAWIDSENLDMPTPLDLDATGQNWPTGDYRAVISINMIHISPWASCEGLMRNSGNLLSPGGVLYLYGPFMVDARHTAASNQTFDQDLRQRNPDWGIRDIDQVTQLAEENGFTFRKKVEMPANNLSVIFERQ